MTLVFTLLANDDIRLLTDGDGLGQMLMSVTDIVCNAKHISCSFADTRKHAFNLEMREFSNRKSQQASSASVKKSFIQSFYPEMNNFACSFGIIPLVLTPPQVLAGGRELPPVGELMLNFTGAQAKMIKMKVCVCLCVTVCF